MARRLRLAIPLAGGASAAELLPMTSANPPERTRFFGAREGVDSPPIHAVERDEEVTPGGLPVDVWH
jgi:hypothetical protein